MHFPRFLIHFAAAALTAQQAFAGSDQELEKQLLEAFRPGNKESRQERAGKAIREYKASGVLAFKPQRIDYTDYYVVGKPTVFMGNALVAVMEEYQVKYIGCCVNPGAGVYFRVVAGIEPVRQFARSNRCRVEEFADRKAFLAAVPFTAGMEEGKYGALLCQESDEAESTATPPTVQAPARSTAQQPPAPVQPRPAPNQVGQVIINAGATLCPDMYSMNKALAIARTNNPYAQLPEGCVVMSRAVATRVLRESTPIPGVVVVQAGSTAAMVLRSDLSYRRGRFV